MADIRMTALTPCNQELTHRSRRVLLCKIVLPLLLPLLTLPVFAFEIDGSKWLGAETEIYADMNGISISGTRWNVALLSGILEWNNKTPFNFILREEKIDPCANDGRNGVDFVPDLCDDEFGENTLAVTITWVIPQILGEPRLSQADILINQNVGFDVYDGNLFRFGFPHIDFGRTMLHELGHVLGLNHENGKPAIMSTAVGDTFLVQADDIAGVETLYGGLSNCDIKPLRFGLLSDALDDNDCTVVELTVGGTDTSFIDLYSFELTSSTTVNFSMTSASLDSILILADADLRYLDYDDKSADVCNSTLTRTLPPGSYFLLANTWDAQSKPECGVVGEYQIASSFSSTGLAPLGTPLSRKGGAVTAGFSGGISNDGGASFGNQFNADDSLDISAMIRVDAQHQGEPGFIVVAAILPDRTLLLNQQGNFVDIDENPGFIERAAIKTLNATESVNIATNLVPSALGITDIVVDFFIGYGLQSDPDEIYYHETPLNLTISP